MQELIAPRHLIFLCNDWTELGIKSDLSEKLSEITDIPKTVLVDCDTVRYYCVAERMRWASRRITTRSEDVAYCLLGLSRVHMPLLYGEGQVAAFARLQEAMMQKTTDHSLLAWKSELPYTHVSLSGTTVSTMEEMLLHLAEPPVSVVDFRPALAPSPKFFSTDHVLQAGVSKIGAVYPSRMTNKGLELTLPIRRQQGSHELYHARLLCSHGGEAAILTLRLLGPFDNRFARVQAPLIFEPGTDFIRPKASPGPPFFASTRLVEQLPLISHVFAFMLRPRWEQTTIFIVQELSAGDYLALPKPARGLRPSNPPRKVTSYEVDIDIFGDQWYSRIRSPDESAHLESWEFATNQELCTFLLCSWLIMQGQYERSDGLGAPLLGLNLAFLPVWVLNLHMNELHTPFNILPTPKLNRNTWLLLFKILGLGLVYAFVDFIVSTYVPIVKQYTRLINLCLRPFAFIIWSPRPSRSAMINMISLAVRLLGSMQLLCELWRNRYQYQQIFAMSIEWIRAAEDTLGAWTDPRHILLLQIYCSTLVHQLQIDRQTRSGAWPMSVIIAFTLTVFFAYPDIIHGACSKVLPFS